MLTFWIYFFLYFIFNSTPEASASCNIGWSLFQDSCYFIPTSLVTHRVAKSDCMSLGAYLVKIKSLEENVFITTLTGNSPHGDGTRFWIQGNDIVNEGTFVFGNGELMPYFNWQSGNPNNENNIQHCLELGILMPTHTSRRWNDVGCITSASYPFICEMNPIEIQTTQTAEVEVTTVTEIQLATASEPETTTVTEPQSTTDKETQISKPCKRYAKFSNEGSFAHFAVTSSHRLRCGVTCSNEPTCVAYTIGSEASCVIMSSACSVSNANPCYDVIP